MPRRAISLTILLLLVGLLVAVPHRRSAACYNTWRSAGPAPTSHQVPGRSPRGPKSRFLVVGLL